MTTQPLQQTDAGSETDGWEYMTADFSKPSRDTAELDRLGADGWEAVSMVTTWGMSEMRFAHPLVLLKRRLNRTPTAR